jgi:hypothetical protein
MAGAAEQNVGQKKVSILRETTEVRSGTEDSILG